MAERDIVEINIEGGGGERETELCATTSLQSVVEDLTRIRLDAK